MDWTAGILGGLMGGSQAAQTILQEQRTHAQKMQDEQQQEKLYEQRQRFVENLKAPAEKSVVINDPKTGRPTKVTSQWVPPPDDNTPGHYQEVGREIVPAKYTKDTITTGSGVKQNVLYNENDPTDVHNLGAPDDTEAQRTAIERQNAGIAGGRLAEETRYHNQEHDDRVNGIGPKQSSVPHDLDLPGGVKVQGNLVPGRGFVPMQTPDGTFAVNNPKGGTDAQGNPVPPAPTDFDSINKYFSPPSNFPGSFQFDADQQKAAQAIKRTPMSQLSGSAINAGGSGAQQTPRPAQASMAATGPGGAGPTPQASAQGKGQPKLQVNRSTGQKRYVYPDGTIVPVGQ